MGMPHGPRQDADGRFTDFYREHQASVHAYVARRCPDTELASQVVAETFTVTWRRLDDALRGGRPWLFRTALLSLNNSLRTERRQARTASRSAAHDLAREVRHGGVEASTAELLHVREVLATLPVRDQEILMLAYWDDLATAEVASALGCSTGTAAVRLHRARARFRRALSTSDDTSIDALPRSAPRARRKETVR